jgi:hypothetical protein
MAKGSKGGKLAAVPEPAEDEEASKYGVEDREPGELHEAFAAWVQEEIGEKVSPRAVQLAWALRNAFRKSEAYEPFRTAKEQRAAAKEAGEDEEAPAKPAKRGKKAAAAGAEEATPAKATKARGRKATKAAAAPAAPF